MKLAFFLAYSQNVAFITNGANRQIGRTKLSAQLKRHVFRLPDEPAKRNDLIAVAFRFYNQNEPVSVVVMWEKDENHRSGEKLLVDVDASKIYVEQGAESAKDAKSEDTPGIGAVAETAIQTGSASMIEKGGGESPEPRGTTSSAAVPSTKISDPPSPATATSTPNAASKPVEGGKDAGVGQQTPKKKPNAKRRKQLDNIVSSLLTVVEEMGGSVVLRMASSTTAETEEDIKEAIEYSDKLTLDGKTIKAA